ncbi:MAG: hypothetical protein H7Y09_07745 [Chitinophagaceae bacterium]|nr:hypothetical protein [Anaerolineae bacterium]
MNNEQKGKLDYINYIEGMKSVYRNRASDELSKLKSLELKETSSDEDSDELILSIVGPGSVDLPTSTRTVIGEFQYFESFIAGYLSQVNNQSLSIENAQIAIRQLESYRLPYVLSYWHNLYRDNFPKLMSYIQISDYLRLLLIEYIKSYFVD